MARPVKEGLEYFPLDIDFFDDPKILFIENLFGEKGELVVVKLLTWIYRNGYYCEWNDEICLLFTKKSFSNFKPSFVQEVTAELLKRGFFNESVFKRFGILTSKGIQKRWLNAIKRSKRSAEINSEFNLVSSEETNINEEETPLKLEESTQSKVKQSKVKKSKVKEIKEEETDNNFLEKVFETEPAKLFIMYWRRNPSPHEVFEVKKLIEDHGIEDVKNSFHKAMEQGSEKMNIAYVKGIFKNLLKERFDLEQKERKQLEMKEAELDRKKDVKIISQKYQELWSRFRKIKDLLTPLEQDRLIQFLNTNQLDKAETKIEELENESEDQPEIKTGTVESLALSMKIS